MKHRNEIYHSAFRILRPEGKGRFIIFCDHASNRIPAKLENLGLPASELDRHIAVECVKPASRL